MSIKRDSTVCRVTRAYIQRIQYRLPFTLSNKIKLFKRMQSLDLTQCHILMWLYIYIAWLRLWPYNMAMYSMHVHAHNCLTTLYRLHLLTVQLLGIWSRFHCNDHVHCTLMTTLLLVNIESRGQTGIRRGSGCA